jgi:uncharacterized membrane protein
MRQLPLKAIFLRYLLPFVGIYLVLLGIGYLPPVRAAIKNTVRTQTGNVLTSLLPDALFISDPNRIAQEEDPAQITLAYGNRAAITQAVRQSGAVGMDVRTINYAVDPTFLMGTFFFISLLLISPVSWKRKGISLLIGGVILYLLNCLLIYVFAIQKIANADMGIYELSSAKLEWYKGLGDVLNNANVFVIPLIVWGLVTFRVGDLRSLMRSLKTNDISN